MRLFNGFSKFSFAEITSTVISVAFWAIIASQISPDEYGQIQYFVGIASIASTISLVGAGPTLVVLISKKKDIQSIIILISIIICSIISYVIYIMFNRYDLMLLIFGMMIFQLSGYVLQAKQQYNKYLIYIVAQKIIFVIMTELCLIFIGSQFIIFAIASSYVIFLNIIMKNVRLHNLNFDFFKEKPIFVLSNYAVSLSAIFKDNIDKLIVFPILGFAILGNYSLALQAVLVLCSLVTILTRYSLPLLSSGRSVDKYFKVAFLISLPLVIIGYWIFPLFIETIFPNYTNTIDAIKIISISIPAYALIAIYNTKLLAAEKSNYVLMGFVGFLGSIIPMMIIFGSDYGINGVSISYVVSIHIQFIILYIIYNKIIRKNILN